MIVIKYQVMNGGMVSDGPFERKFASEPELYEWLNSQRGHPWLHIEVISTIDQDKCKHVYKFSHSGLGKHSEYYECTKCGFVHHAYIENL